jgi:hypothetical protein
MGKRSYIAAVVSLLLAGCAVDSVHKRERPPRTNELEFVFRVEGTRPPLLSSNEVVRIAWERARRYRRDMDGYVCDFMSFSGDTTNSFLTNKWIIHFIQKQRPWELHSDFFVDIDDATRAVNLVHH